MSKVNVKRSSPLVTHEGGPAREINAFWNLKRSLMACMLWEDTFYEEGVEISKRIKKLVKEVKPEEAKNLAIEARENMKIRHAPLWVVRAMAQLPEHKKLVAETLERVIQRPDELTEFLALYWLNGKQPLSNQVKKGLAKAFTKFDAYQLAKYNRDGQVKLRDVMFLTHPKPLNLEQEEIWEQLVDGTLLPPDTWEVELSSGKDKKETWERLLSQNKLGALALLRNLRNMEEVGVNRKLIIEALRRMKTEKVLPFRFIAAARYAPSLEPYLEEAMFKCIPQDKKIQGKTILLIDVSLSMTDPISKKSEMTRMDAAAGLAILAREMCEEVNVYTFSDNEKLVPPRRGFALRDAIVNSQSHNGTYLGRSISAINQKEQYDRIIVFTDEQSADSVPAPESRGYMINVANYENGVGYGSWTHIDGFSEAVIDYILEYEKLINNNY
ncbi:MAG: hypothetical protein PWQ59_2372 [Thermoanaerobacterium sp.]|nr:hypothetical protein [Thermoanaerobacterium sp.]